MGQYFDWVNPDKKEMIGSYPWKCGFKLEENTYLGNEKTDAMLTLMATRWKGDRVIFLGDYAEFKNETNPYRRAFELDLGGHGIEGYLFEDLEDVAGVFKWVRDEGDNVHYDDETGDDVPYTGPFDTDIQAFRYVLDDDAQEYVDRLRCPVRYISSNPLKVLRYDPVPILLCSFEGGHLDPLYGRWFGHRVRPTNDAPPETYVQIGQDYCYWTDSEHPVINEPDDEVIAAIGRIRESRIGFDPQSGFREIRDELDNGL